MSLEIDILRYNFEFVKSTFSDLYRLLLSIPGGLLVCDEALRFDV